jgi:hypothetical protein
MAKKRTASSTYAVDLKREQELLVQLPEILGENYEVQFEETPTNILIVLVQKNPYRSYSLPFYMSTVPQVIQYLIDRHVEEAKQALRDTMADRLLKLIPEDD